MVKFKIEYAADEIIEKQLLYLEDECSFYMKYNDQNTDLELIINKISLQVSNDRVINLSGFCGLNNKMKSDVKVPEFKKGILKVEHNLQSGFAYGINDDIDYKYPIYINIKMGWVCIGNPNSNKNAVEFITNCVAVIDDKGNFESLWLKPKNLPKKIL